MLEKKFHARLPLRDLLLTGGLVETSVHVHFNLVRFLLCNAHTERLSRPIILRDKE